MRRAWVACLPLMVVALSAATQDAAPKGGAPKGSANYTTMKIDRAGQMAYQPGRRVHITGGLDITLVSDDPNTPGLRLRAEEGQFLYAEKGSAPSEIEMKRNVRVDGPMGAIKSDEAVVNTETKHALFTGNVQLDSDDVKGLRAERLDYNIESGEAIMNNVRAESIPLGGPEKGPQAPAGAAVLREEDVKDWPALLSKLKEQGAANEPSPGKRIASLMDAKARKTLTDLSPEQPLTAKAKAGILNKLNGVLAKKDLYDEASWKGVELSEEAQALVKDVATLSEQDAHRLNRMLIEAAFPDAITKGSKG